jgi:entericidin B
MIRKLIFALSVSVMALGASACNTVRGAGDDLNSAANEVDKEI